MPVPPASASQPQPATGLAILVSGTGSIMEAIIKSGLPVSVVLADRPCRGLEVAAAAGVPTALVQRADFGWPAKGWDRAGFTDAIIAELRRRHIGLIAMSGFMTLLGRRAFDEFDGRILNTHPSLLPAFKGEGAKVVRDTLAAGVKETGCSVQVATFELDDGPVLAQDKVPVLSGDTPDTLWERIKVTERKLYPKVIRERLHSLANQSVA